MALLLLWVSACTTPSAIQPSDLRAFSSDGCSRFPDGTSQDRKLWCHCCLEHDQAYWQGGDRQQRKAADAQLRACVRKAGRPKTAALMQLGVRAGGSPLWPSRFRWGYGWPYYRGYRPLSDAESERAAQLLVDIDTSVCELPDTENR